MKKGMARLIAGTVIAVFLIVGSQIGGVSEPIKSEADVAQSLEWHLMVRNREEETTGNLSKYRFMSKGTYSLDNIITDIGTLTESFLEKEIINQELYDDTKKSLEEKDYKEIENNLRVMLSNAGLKEEPKNKEEVLSKYKKDIFNKVDPVYAYRNLNSKGIENEIADLSIEWVGTVIVQTTILGIMITISALYGVLGFFIEIRRTEKT